mgnify:CR=1 FL=1
MTTAYAPQNTPENRARLESIMRHRHSGQGRAAKKSELLTEMWGPEAAADKSYNNLYDRSLREMFDEINAHGGLVCSDSVRGYWWAESLEDGLPAARQKIARGANIIESGRVLERNILDAYGGQLSLLGDQ